MPLYPRAGIFSIHFFLLATYPNFHSALIKAYPDYKITWARFLFYRDWLNDCPLCTDGVILTDVRDAYFQRDPFTTAVKLNQQHPLMLFEEIPALDNTHWLTDFPVMSCRNYKVGTTRVLCSGSVMGSREGIFDYLKAMATEFDYWKTRDNCRIDMPGEINKLVLVTSLN